MSWEPLAIIGAAALIFVGILVWLVRASKAGATASDDLDEAKAATDVTDKAVEAMRDAPKTPRDLVADLKRRMRDND